MNTNVLHNGNPRKEMFYHDATDRLYSAKEITYYQDNSTSVRNLFNISYNQNRITSHWGVGSYLYNHPIKPHALTGVELYDENTISLNQCDISYNAFQKVKTIDEGDYHYDVRYYPNKQQAVSTLEENGVVISQKQYAGKAFEVDNVTGTKYHYIYAYGEPIAVFIQQGNGEFVPYTILTDHLGSIDMILDRNGNAVDSMSFDAWGNRRNRLDWTEEEGVITHLIDRGFTFHQHLDVFGLINMGGRIYDPEVAQFLSPDPYVQMPDNTQSLNRYAYCMNSPLMFVDPDGEFWHIIIGALVGGTVNLIANWKNIDKVWQGFAYFGIGAAAGALGAGIGAGISAAIAGGSFGAGFIGSSAALTSTGALSGAAVGAGAGFSSGFTTGLGNGLMQGQTFSQSLWNGTKTGLIAGGTGALFGGIYGGFDALSKGRNFWTGSYKQYDLQVNNIASTDNSTAYDQYSFPDDATIANADQYKVYYKPEDGVYGTKNYVSPGKYIKNPIDGVATSKYTNMVFKVPDGGRVRVLLGGEVKFTNGFGLYDAAKLVNKAGWLPLNKLDNSWETLFRMALIIKK